MNKTPTLSVSEFRAMNGMGSNDTWEARIEGDGSVWLSIPGEALSLNKTLREHPMAAWRRLRVWTANLQALVAVKKLPRFEKAQVRVVYYFRTNRRRDEPNYSHHKQLLDAMVKANIIADDNAKVLKLLPVEFEVDKQRPRTEVWVSEWTEERGAEK